MHTISRKSLLLISVLLALLMMCLTAFASSLSGEWVYPDTPDQAVMTIDADGNFLFEDHRYTIDVGEDFSYLKPLDEALPALRCTIGEDAVILYRQLEYARHPNDKGAGLPGAWLCTTGKSVFILGADGLFMEDGLFTGSYTVDNENSSFRLIYDKSFGLADTVCFYQLTETTLVIEYPWKLIRKP